MKIAVLSDVHANSHALRAVLGSIDSDGCDAVWNLGDFIGYGPRPRECVEMLRQRATENIRGNYDRRVIRFPRKKDKWKKKKAPEKYLAFRWAYESLTSEQLTWLDSLPAMRDVQVGRRHVLLTHGSPAADDEALTARTSEDRLEELAHLAGGADIVCCGHSHVQFCRDVAGVTFINPGSVGRSEGGDNRAAYAMLDLDDHTLNVDLRRVEYDVQAVAAELQALNLPSEFAEMFVNGRNLDQVKAAAAGGESDTVIASDPSNQKCLNAVLHLAEAHRYERDHAHQVTRLSLMLLDELAEVAELTDEDRFILRCAGLLHDIGWSEGQKGHHKTAMQAVMNDRTIPFSKSHRRLTACVVRYHRKALPKDSHDVFGDLDDEDRRRVSVLGGMLRLADGLDRSHLSLVESLSAVVSESDVQIAATVRADAAPERWAWPNKADLLSRALNRRINVTLTSAGLE